MPTLEADCQERASYSCSCTGSRGHGQPGYVPHAPGTSSISWALVRRVNQNLHFDKDSQVTQVYLTVCKALVYTTGSNLAAQRNHLE